MADKNITIKLKGNEKKINALLKIIETHSKNVGLDFEVARKSKVQKIRKTKTTESLGKKTNTDD